VNPCAQLDIIGEVAEMRLHSEGTDSRGFNNTLHGMVFAEANLPMKTDFAIFVE
jgi:hypothetical protein